MVEEVRPCSCWPFLVATDVAAEEVVESFLLPVVEAAVACCWEVVEIPDSEAPVVLEEGGTDLLVAVEQTPDLEEVESDSC